MYYSSVLQWSCFKLLTRLLPLVHYNQSLQLCREVVVVLQIWPSFPTVSRFPMVFMPLLPAKARLASRCTLRVAQEEGGAVKLKLCLRAGGQ